MEKIEARLSKILYHSDSFVIFKSCEDFTLKGYIFDEPELLLESRVEFEGSFGSSKYGKEFEFFSYKILEDEILFFLTKIIGGIPKKVAQDIADRFGSRFEYILSNSPKELLEIKGIKEKKLAKILEKWEEKKHIKNLASTLLPYGITNNLISKIYSAFGEKSLEVIEENPYRLCEIRGIGFKISDDFARKVGVKFNAKDRIDSCILYSLKEESKNGHTVVLQDRLYEIFREESRVEDRDISEDEFNISIDRLSKNKKISQIFKHEESFVALKEIEERERYILNKINFYKESRAEENSDCELFIEEFEKSHGIIFGERQKEAIRLAHKRFSIFTITGYAGSGKTTTSKAILHYYKSIFKEEEIICTALSGIAANRIKKQSGFHSCTIHSLLSYDFANGGFKYNKDNSLPYKVVLLDEASMVDVTMFYHLLLAIDLDSTTFIMLGDPAQLPPVGAGNIFADILDFSIVENVTLDKIYRQNEDKKINIYAQNIREGKIPEIGLGEEDFFFLNRSIQNYWQLKSSLTQIELRDKREENHKKIAQEIGEIASTFIGDIRDLYSQDIWASLLFFQLITPMKEGVLGAKNLNIVLQNVLNPQKNQKSLQLSSKREFRVRDKVVHLQNRNMSCFYTSDFQDYKDGKEIEMTELRVYNGQIGVLFFLNSENDEYLVYFPNEEYIAIYSKSDFTNGTIDLAYALTIHKTQGSEFSNVLIPLSLSHYIMLNNKLLYTAVTRAKEKLCIIGEKYAFDLACKKADETKRDTLIRILCS